MAIGLLVLALIGCTVYPNRNVPSVNLNDPDPCPGQVVRYKVEPWVWGLRVHHRVIVRDQLDAPGFTHGELEGQFQIPDPVPTGDTAVIMEVIIQDGPYTTGQNPSRAA